MKEVHRIMIFALLIIGMLNGCGNAEKSQEPEVIDEVSEETIEDSGQEAVELEDFSMPKSKKPDRTKYENLAVIKEEKGLDFQTPKEFSNGYVFLKFEDVGTDTISVAYDRGGNANQFMPYNALLSVTASLGTLDKGAYLLETIEIEGVEVEVHLYVHLDLPENWEEIITKEQQRMLDEGIADTGTDGGGGDIIELYHYDFLWEQGDYEFELHNGYGDRNDITREEMEQIVAEVITANQK